jgi:hypothetical protein
MLISVFMNMMQLVQGGVLLLLCCMLPRVLYTVYCMCDALAAWPQLHLLLLLCCMLPQVLYNVYRMCDAFVDDSCLESRDADQCVYEHMMQLVQGNQGSRAGSSGTAAAALSPGAIAGIAIAGEVGVVERCCNACRVVVGHNRQLLVVFCSCL